MTDLSTIRAWLADPTAPNDEACGYVADLLSEIDRLTSERATLSAPVEGVNVDDVLRREARRTALMEQGNEEEAQDDEWWLLNAAPTLAREVQRLRLEVADLRTHHTEALTAAGAPLTDGDGKTLSDPQRLAYLSDLVDDGKARHLFQRLVERTAAALGLVGERFDPEIGEMCLPSWHDIPEQVEQLVKRSAARETP